VEFELDARNLNHFLVDHPDRGLDEAVLARIASIRPKVFSNEPRVNRSGSHIVIGPDDSGRMWTIVVVHIREDTWRPITGWPSTPSEMRKHEETPDVAN
jgi:hypothetical protein